MKITDVSFEVNGTMYEFSVGDKRGQIPASETLIITLRERLGLTGAKKSCEEGACGCCTVLIDGEVAASCMVLTVACEGKHIMTIESLQDRETGALDPLQQAFIDEYAFQCGYCTPGIIMAAKALLLKNQNPTQEEVEDALSGNYCRCISHYHVFKAIKRTIGGGDAE